MKFDFYWSKGLHDANIVSCSIVNLDYDYKLKNPNRNYLQLDFDSSKAMFDTDVKSIRFYNFKCDSVKSLENSYWVKDEFKYENNKFILNIAMTKNKGKEITSNIICDDIEVIRYT